MVSLPSDIPDRRDALSYRAGNAAEELRFKAQVAKVPDEQQKHHVMEIVTSWMEAGLEQGRHQKAREDVIEVLEARFGEIPYALREQILAVVGEAELKRLHRQAVLVPDLPAFEHALAQCKAG